MHKMEIRAGSPVELRAKEDGLRVSGHAAVFDQDANIGGMFVERFSPGAFSEAIERDDVVFLVNHDGLPLARTRSGTLKLREDKTGLVVESRLDESDPDVARIVPKMKRGDLDKMSIAFRAVVEEWDDSGDIPVRTIRSAALYDVSVVNMPAYDGTDIGLRSLQAHRANLISPLTIAARIRGKIALGTI